MLSAKPSALNTAGPCQSPELLESSGPYPRFLTRVRLLSWYREREGLFAALRRMAIALVPGLRTARRKTARLEIWEDEIQNLQPGEWIEVKSRDEILSTLDQNAKHRGLRFVPEMYDFCGRRFRVFKRVEKICIENTPDVRRITNTVLLASFLGLSLGCLATGHTRNYLSLTPVLLVAGIGAGTAMESVRLALQDDERR